ncbi:MAG: hypothetical protein J6R68_06460 [Clostridia bacterium]|nr:hypothetical protein [Clostridia bacterium]
MLNFAKIKIRINKNDIIGKRVGKLVVKEYAFAKYAFGKKDGCKKVRHFYLCECDCGVKKLVQRGPLLNEIVMTCGCSRIRSDSKIKAKLLAPTYLPVNPDFDKTNWILEKSKEVHCAAVDCFYNLDSLCDCKKSNINPGLLEECPQFVQD